MKRVLQILIILFVLYYLIQIVFNFFDKGYETTYKKTIDNKEISIKETYIANQKQERDNYFLEITDGNNHFYIKTYHNFQKMKNIVKDIKYIQTDNYTCILPIYIGDKILHDAICQNDDITTYYYNIQGSDSKIDNFINDLKEYNISDWKHETTTQTTTENVTVYEDNLESNLFIGLNSYKGLYSINPTYSQNIINQIIFKDDIYNQQISTQIENYYLVADYNSTYKFNSFYLIDLTLKGYSNINTDHDISFNSYFQGVVDNFAYLIDIDNKKQYEIDINTKKVIEVGNADTGIKFYNNNQWEEKTIYDAINQKLIFTSNVDSKIFEQNYVKIDKIGGEKTGYYYLYEQTLNGYNVYKAYVEQPNNPILLFNVKDIERIKYINDSIIFVDDNYVKIYNDNYGIKTLIKYDELTFNKSINIFAYYKN